MWYLLAILTLTATATGDATATRLDGAVVVGPLADWHDGHLTLAPSTGNVDVPESELLSLQLALPPAKPSGEPTVELVDGSVLPITTFATKDKASTIEIAAPANSKSLEVSVPLSEVRAVRLQPLDDAVLPQWQEIHDVDSPSDVLVVLKREGQSLDYLEGVVKEVTPTDVAFELDGDTVRVGRAKVAGVIYYRAEKSDEQAATQPCILTGSNGLRVAAKSVRVEGGIAHIVTSSGLEIDWPLSDIYAADFSAGKVAYISDLEPVSQEWRPLVALPAAAKNALRYGQPRLNQSAAGGPLTLLFPASERVAGTGRLEKFAKGLALRSHSDYVVRLPSGYTKFLALAGIEPTTQSSGNVMLTIFGDDRLLMESPVAGDTAPVPIELDVAGVRRLRIVVDYGQNLDTGDWLNLCNARLVK